MQGIGIDIEKISRFKNHLKLSKKILSSDELVYYNNLNSEIRRREYIAGRWVAKEAVTKALNHIPNFKEINIFLKNNILNCEYKGEILLLSISHSEDDAIAYCVRR